MTTKTKYDENLEENFDQDSFEELRNLHKESEAEQRDLEVTTAFFEHVSPHYRHVGETEREHFNPMVDSAYRRGQLQGEYYVHYSFPNGAQYPVASFWLYREADDGKKYFRYIHLDLSKVVDSILKYYTDIGFEAPPERK